MQEGEANGASLKQRDHYTSQLLMRFDGGSFCRSLESSLSGSDSGRGGGGFRASAQRASPKDSVSVDAELAAEKLQTSGRASRGRCVPHPNTLHTGSGSHSKPALSCGAPRLRLNPEPSIDTATRMIWQTYIGRPGISPYRSKHSWMTHVLSGNLGQYYDEIVERCTRPTPDGCCCNLFLCHWASSLYQDWSCK